LILILILICYLVYILISPMTEGMVDIPGPGSDTPLKYYFNSCQYQMTDVLKDVLETNKIEKTENTNGDAQLYIPCIYDDGESETKKFPPLKPTDRVFLIDNADEMVSKRQLWINVLKHHGLNKAKTLLPMTYILNDPKDMTRFKTDFSPDRIFILKKNEQRQEGLKITKSLEEILNGSANGYVVVQDLLQNPYIIGGRKTNMRFYVLVVCSKGALDVYVFNNGFMYYTKEYFIRNCLEFAPNITTGYIDRKVYDENPLTHTDFKEYLDNPGRTLTEPEHHISHNKLSLGSLVFHRINQVLKDVFSSFIGKICNGPLDNSISFQLFGVDVALDDELQATVMEINKGPDMNAKDERDGELKRKCVKDIMRLIGLINDHQQHGFTHILEFDHGILK
jgi:hypothetical protein